MVQTDARLVENVEDPHELRANLRRQAQTLRLAAGERRGATVKGEVSEADLLEKVQPLRYLMQYRLADNSVISLELEFHKELVRPLDTEPARAGNVDAVDLYSEAFPLKS
jgi:aminoglycoside phosphotransferase